MLNQSKHLILFDGTKQEVDIELPQPLARRVGSVMSEEKAFLCGSIATTHDRQAFQVYANSLISGWATTKLKGMVGIINQLGWHWANCWGGVK